MIELHDKYLILLLVNHPVLGYLAQPYLVTQSGDSVFVLSEKLTVAHVEAWKDELPDSVYELALASDQYSDRELYRKFCTEKKKQNVNVFMKNLDEDRVARTMRPQIEKAVSEVLFLSMGIGMHVFPREATRSVFLGDEIHFASKPVDTTMQFTRIREGIKYSLTLEHNQERLNILNEMCEVITNFPAWILFKSKLYFFNTDFDGNKVKPFLKNTDILIPARIEFKYFKQYIRKSVRGGNVIAEGFDIIDLVTEKQSILSFEHNPFMQPSLSLVFRYGDKKVDSIKPGRVIVDLRIEEDNYSFLRLTRDQQWEQDQKEVLRSLGLKETMPGSWAPEAFPDTFTAEDMVHWINENAKIIAEQKMALVDNYYGKKYYINGYQLNTETTSHEDWFDLKLVIVLGNGVEIPFAALRNNILSGIREFLLPDGRTFVIPFEWFATYRDLCDLAKVEKNIFRIRPAFYPVFEGMGWKMPTANAKDEGIEYPLPQGLKTELRPYQFVGFQWMKRLQKAGLGGCLADDMGLGKTIQAIAFLLSYHNPSAEIKKSKSNKKSDLLKDESDAQTKKSVPSLIVMPSSLVHNWNNECKKFAPSLKTYKYVGTARRTSKKSFETADIVFTTYGTLRNDIEKLENEKFGCVILDESQVIKNPDSKTRKAVMTLNANQRFVLSGTPVENSLLDLWSQMDFVNSGMLGEREMFKRVFLNPVVKKNDEDQLEKLKTITAPFILRRTKDMVAKELPPKMEQTLFCNMTPDQKSMYDEEKSKVRNELFSRLEENNDPTVKFAVLAALTHLRQISNHPLLVDDTYTGDAGKFEEVVRNVETVVQEGHKLLMFSSFVEHLNLYAKYFDEHEIGYSMLTGSTRNREEVIDEFKVSVTKNVFLISLKAGGVGLNLTEADYVFILDPWWNPAAEEQAIDRTHRIGQEKNVFVYRFISKDSIEEKIVKLQQKKQKMAKEIIQSGENPLFHMSNTDLELLLK